MVMVRKVAENHAMAAALLSHTTTLTTVRAMPATSTQHRRALPAIAHLRGMWSPLDLKRM